MKIAVITTGIVGACTIWASAAHCQTSPQPPPAALERAATDRASYFANADLQAIWKDLESKQVINKRVLEGGRYSINIRIVRPDSPPMVHSKSADVWVVTAGSATAITGGTLTNPKQGGASDDTVGTAIINGVEQPLKPGDIVLVPTGVPHGFTKLKGFRALLIRFEMS
jgi:mannose-6-phosphate isomerase-like protein (cupin superfamily)